MKNTRYITASELGDFVYCKRGWWLRCNNQLSPTGEMLMRTEAHNTLAKRLSFYKVKLYLAVAIITICITLLILFFFIHKPL